MNHHEPVIETATARWGVGDAHGVAIPADADALLAGGADFLTTALAAAGALAAGNRVTRIVAATPINSGGTGSKLALTVAYAEPATAPSPELFVKFSRNFADPIRDSVRHMLHAEVEFALLSRVPGFPVAVPRCLFGDFEQASGTGLLITECVPYGSDGVEPQHIKCMDHQLADPLAYYRVLVDALATLAGSFRGGALGRDLTAAFPFDRDAALAKDRIRYDERQLRNRLARLTQFIARYPQLFPTTLRDPAFHARLIAEAPLFQANEAAIRRYLHADSDLISLCHWNANIDNAWFWREAGQLRCGLIDWGLVGQMSVAQSLYGCLSGAQPAIWNDRFDELVARFCTQYVRSGGPLIDADTLKRHTVLFTAMMGLAYLLDAPAIIERRGVDLAAAASAIDPRLLADEDLRVQLHMVTMFLNQWQTQPMAQLLDAVIAAEGGASQ